MFIYTILKISEWITPKNLRYYARLHRGKIDKYADY
jgi:hypothetical protein